MNLVILLANTDINNPQVTFNAKPIYVLLVSQSPNLSSLAPRPAVFLLMVTFRQTH